jgi:hypothetical protein
LRKSANTLVPILILAAVACKTSDQSQSGGELANLSQQERVALQGDKLPSLPYLDQSIDGVISYLQGTQATHSDGENILKGEWGSQMLYRKKNFIMNRLTTAVGTQTYDSNCFETASTAIALADIYIQYHDTDSVRLAKLVPMLNLAMDKILQCKETTGGFAFWPYIDMPKKWKDAFPNKKIPDRIRGPKHFPYESYAAQLQNSNYADGDDTALSIQAFLKFDQITKGMLHQTNSFSNVTAQKIGPSYAKYRDGIGTGKAKFAYPGSVGSFLVWWGEKSDKLLGLGETPPVMPMNFNVIDCVASTNSLGALSLKKESDQTNGFESTCRHVNEMVRSDKDKECGLYYPNPYNLHYAIAEAIHNGSTCLEPSRAKLVQDLEKSQRLDGSWPPFENEQADTVQTVLFALGAYLKLADPGVLQSDAGRKIVFRGVNYLLAHRIDDKNLAPHWEPGIHFSAGPALQSKDGLRGTVVWKSRGFTNAMILEIFYQIKDVYKNDFRLTQN